ncbi:sulfurtransferase [Duganella sp. FT3S]|uniref:Sulfurtransferase n=1 Tax=Rugamonas fusca TaxID=2758568 RepID=A0A7W2EEA1_9BURK|nr:rhodanese-like domain-containing protein [Rugamonas fusca]MBA5604357.1 sulfurtransferase [Rugamonas fusca]
MQSTSRLLCAAIWLALAGAAGHASAFDAAAVPEAKRAAGAQYVDAKEAYALKQRLGEHAYMVDVRTRYEVAYLGMPTVADANIPYLEHPDDAGWDAKNGRWTMSVNNDFGPELARRLTARGMGKDDTVILMCRSGDRSGRAANLLVQLGYHKVYTVVDGFEGDLAKDGPQAGQRVVNGWKNAGLPWTYKLEPAKLYYPQF